MKKFTIRVTMKYLKIIKVIQLNLVLLIIFSSLINCNRTKNSFMQDTIFIYATNYYKIHDKYGWEKEMEATGFHVNALQTGETYYGGYYSYKKEENHTLYDLYFELYFNDNDTIFIPHHCYKRYISDDWQHIVSFDKGGDTLYHYKAELFGRMMRFFISGEYSYKYEFGEMNSYERSFFEKHKDSLRSIRGMNLPPLPGSLDTIEKIK